MSLLFEGEGGHLETSCSDLKISIITFWFCSTCCSKISWRSWLASTFSNRSISSLKLMVGAGAGAAAGGASGADEASGAGAGEASAAENEKTNKIYH